MHLLFVLPIILLSFTHYGCGVKFTTGVDTNLVNQTNKTISGKIVDPPLSNAAVGVDINTNGLLDSAEVLAVTNNLGVFTFNVARTLQGNLIASGGIDTGLTRPFIGTLKRTLPSLDSSNTIISPLTTLVSEGMTETQVKTIFSLDASISVTETDPTINFQVLRAGATVHSIVLNMSSKVGSSPTNIYKRLSSVTSFTTLSFQSVLQTLGSTNPAQQAIELSSTFTQLSAASDESSLNIALESEFPSDVSTFTKSATPFSKFLGTDGMELPDSMVELANGNLVISGWVSTRTTFPLPEHDGIVFVLSPTQEIIWSKKFTSGGKLRLQATEVLSDGNLIVTGSTDSGTVIVKLNSATGAILWQKSTANLSASGFQSVVVDSSDNFFLAGPGDNGNKIVKVSDAGVVEWTREISGANGIPILTQGSLDGVTGSSGNIIFGLDGSGNLLFKKSTSIDNISAIKKLPSGSYYISGHDSYVQGQVVSASSRVIKMSSTFSVIWGKTFTNIEITSIDADLSENLLIGGWKVISSTQNPSKDPVVAKINGLNGLITWQSSVENPRNSGLRIVNQVLFGSDGGAYSLGTVNSTTPSQTDSDIWIYKLDPNGQGLSTVTSTLTAQDDISAEIADAAFVSSSSLADVFTGNSNFSSQDFLITEGSTNLPISSPPPFSKFLGTNGTDLPYSMTTLTNENLVVSGYSSSLTTFPLTVHDGIVFSLSTTQTIEWSKKFTSGGRLIFHSVETLSDGNLILSGIAEDSTIIMKLDSSTGAIMFQKSIDNLSNPGFNLVKDSSDNLFLIAGGGAGNIRVLKLSSDGTISWVREVSVGQETLGSPRLTTGPLGGVMGSTANVIFALDGSGNLLFKKITSINQINAVKRLSSGAYYIAGFDGLQQGEVINDASKVIKMASDFSIEWSKIYSNIEVTSIDTDQNDNLILAGWKVTSPSQNPAKDPVLTKVSGTTGQLIWQSTITNPRSSTGLFIVIKVLSSSDSGVYSLGSVTSTNPAQSGLDIWVSKLDSNGQGLTLSTSTISTQDFTTAEVVQADFISSSNVTDLISVTSSFTSQDMTLDILNF
jgi:hypothetical protein